MNEEQKRSSDTRPLAGYLNVRQRWLGPASPEPAAWRVSEHLTEAMDRALQDLATSSQLTVLAVGGYGAGRLCLYSDIDLLLLHDGDGARSARTLLYPLWNASLKVGHALRTPREAVAEARQDLTTLCSLLTARRVVGPEPRFSELTEGLTRLLRNERARLWQLLAEEERGLWEREPFPRQDPDLKEGRGGLRSLDRLRWERARRRILDDEQPDIEEVAEQASRTLLSVRAALHAVQRRRADRYALELRGAVGDWLGKAPLEVASELHRAMRKVDVLAGLRFGHGRIPSTDPVLAAGQGIVRFVRDRWARPAAGPRPAPPLQLARTSAQTSTGRLSAFAFTLAAAAPPPEWNEADRRALVGLLSVGRPGWEAITGLWESGWIAGALPELTHLHGLAQGAPFHHHPADTHLGRTVSEVLAIADGAVDWCADIADEVGPLDELLLAAFLHDAGKGLPGDHSQKGAELAQNLLGRLGFGADTAALVGRLVRDHLLLPETAFRGDLDDPAVISRVATRLPDQHHLRLLTLLSVADARATGEDSWSSWRGHLLRQLHYRLAKALHGGDPDIARDARERLQRALNNRIGAEVVEAHLAEMPSGYLLTFGGEAVADHVLLTHPSPGPDEVRLSVNPGAPAATVTAAALDRPGLLALISGILALHNLAVIEARVATRSDGVALDVFRVIDARGADMVGASRWPGVREDLNLAVTGRLDVAARLAEKRAAYGDPGRFELEVIIQRTGNRVRVEVRTDDRIGLLHDVAGVLASLSLDVQWAKIDTRGSRVVDVFSVLDRAGDAEGRDENIRTAIGAVGQLSG